MHGQSDLVSRAQSRVGTMLAGKYRIDALLGVGGMAAVYAATHRNQAEFAIKILHAELSLNADIRTRFLREGYTANSVKHPGAVRVVDDAVNEDGAAFLVMELLRGTTVEELAEARGGRLPVNVVAAIVDQLLDVLSAAHAKAIVHRDIKPANLLLTSDGLVKVLDFGIARAREVADAGPGAATRTGILLGTPAFMSPEQAIAKSRDIDAQTDVWAAAATFFTLVSGRYVHAGETAPEMLVRAATTVATPLASVAPEVPPAISQVVDRGLAFHKAARWSTAAAMRTALSEAAGVAWGAQPTRSTLEQFLAGDLRPPGAPHPRVATLTGPASNAPEQRIVSAQTAPVFARTTSAIATPAPSDPRPSRRTSPVSMIVLGASATAAIAIGGVIAARYMRASGESMPTPTWIVDAEPSAPSAPTVSASGSTTEPAATARSAASGTVAATGAPDAGRQPSTPPVTRTAHPAPKVTPPPVARPHAAPPMSCDPPYRIDADGHRVPKPECI
jgi:eukaryotic-like serine/threonine-protein kinase